ncbi:transposase family protein [Streptomyces sp. NPDC006372]|uniref:transposase family protein n=1 Tax=Streptomyces sp. NPDC006372 TaxID=3155599 RepID=UPI0033B4112D
MLPDPRRRRGVRHLFVAVLLVAACAVTAGARSWAAIGQWSRAATEDTLARLGARSAGTLRVRVAPSLSTVRWVVIAVRPGGFADLTGQDLAGADTVAVDGKCARGSRHGAVPAVHPPAVMTSDGHTVSQLPVPDTTSSWSRPTSPTCSLPCAHCRGRR